MRSRLFVRVRLALAALLWCVMGSVAWAQGGAFDPDRLTRDDTKFIQAALAYEGAYSGRIDGDWGQRSAEALRRMAGNRPTETAVLDVLLPFASDMETAGWRALNPEGTAILIPSAILIEDRGPDFFELRTASRSLVIRYVFRGAGEGREMHDWLEGAHVGAQPFYRARTSEALVSLGEIEGRRRVYLRTISFQDDSETVVVQWDPDQAARARVVTASLSNGLVEVPTIPDYGYIADILSRAAAPPPSPPPPPPAPAPEAVSNGEQEGAGDGPLGSGTGFYVNDTDIVTAEHVVAPCARLTLADGSALLVVGAEPETDLAVLRAARRSQSWLDLAPGPGGALGAPAIAVGYPYVGLFDQGLSVTRGNISALRGLSGEAHVLMLTAPVQPGNSGGPLLNDAGQVIGVISYRASDLYALERSGTIPQNMNAATRLKPLRRFLGDAGVGLPPPSGQGYDTAGGLGTDLTDAVVAIQCHGSL